MDPSAHRVTPTQGQAHQGASQEAKDVRQAGAEDPAIIYEHVWQVGDLVVWDNLACLHARTDWPKEQRRTLRRCTVEGEPLFE